MFEDTKHSKIAPGEKTRLQKNNLCYNVFSQEDSNLKDFGSVMLVSPKLVKSIIAQLGVIHI